MKKLATIFIISLFAYYVVTSTFSSAKGVEKIVTRHNAALEAALNAE